MKNTVVYRPFRSHSWLATATACLVGFAFVVAGWTFPDFKFVIFFFAMGIVSIWLTKVLYDSSNITICFEDGGLRVFDGGHKECQYLLWEKLPYAYYVRNLKGHLYVVLSPKEIDLKQVRYYVNKSSNSFRVMIDYVVVFHIDILQNASELKEMIDNRIKHTDAL